MELTIRRRDALDQFADLAACSGARPGMFYPGTDKPGFSQKEQDAKRVCRTQCEVRRECLTYAIEFSEHFGIWGGYGERARRRIGKKILHGHITIEDALKD
jgi:WhiB family transcriptional regulator, redox-sensing transcriptional regulator